MAIPAPSIKPLRVQRGTHTFVYEGVVGQSGIEQDLHIDLTDIPLRLRKDPAFRDMLQIDFKSLDSGLTFAGPLQPTAFNDDGSETNAYLTIQVSSDSAERNCGVLVEPRHSIGR